MRKRLEEIFFELVVVSSESGSEGEFHELLKKKFGDLGLTLFEDSTKETTGLGGNNLLFTLEGNKNDAPLFFSSHTDTVKPGTGINPIVRNGNVYSDGTTILAADDKAGIAIMLELIAQIKEENLPHPNLEFLLTPGEEIGLIGASAFDISKLESKVGIVLDGGGPVGSITLASPTLSIIDITVHGKSAHAGLEPELGVSAIEIASKAISRMTLGRVSETTTANIGTINGGVSSNIIADKVIISAEARSINETDLANQVDHMKNIFQVVAAELGGKIEFNSTIKSIGYHYSPDSPIIASISKAIEEIGIAPSYEISGGASDANVFNSRGKLTANISIGYEKIHTVDEYIPIAEMEKAILVCKQLVRNLVDN